MLFALVVIFAFVTQTCFFASDRSIFTEVATSIHCSCWSQYSNKGLFSCFRRILWLNKESCTFDMAFKTLSRNSTLVYFLWFFFISVVIFEPKLHFVSSRIEDFNTNEYWRYNDQKCTLSDVNMLNSYRKSSSIFSVGRDGHLKKTTDWFQFGGAYTEIYIGTGFKIRGLK